MEIVPQSTSSANVSASDNLRAEAGRSPAAINRGQITVVALSFATAQSVAVHSPLTRDRNQDRRAVFEARMGDLDIWQFLELDANTRLQIITDLAIRPRSRRYHGPASRLERAFHTMLSATQIVAHARNGYRHAMIQAISDALELDETIIIACLNDTSGEPAAVLLKALGLDNIQAQHVFLFATPTLGLDVNGFIRLSEIYSAMEPQVAEGLIEAWRRIGPSRQESDGSSTQISKAAA